MNSPFLTHRKIAQLGLALLWLCATLVTPLPTTPLWAQAAPPPACLDDQGNALDPKLEGAWIMVLNFNHPLSTQYTTGCLIHRFIDETQPTYRIIYCPLYNNVKAAVVGAGSAKFDGNFWIECLPPESHSGLREFDIQATAHFAQPAALYTLLEHPNVSLHAQVSADWWITLSSHYGATSFNHLDTAPNALQEVQLRSSVYENLGKHTVNGSVLPTPVTVASFNLDASYPFRISGHNQRWLLHQLIVDPRCTTGCG